jgi:GH25 family lysozyme M1 (1,4-beta-N-acetylmuramidase)
MNSVIKKAAAIILAASMLLLPGCGKKDTIEVADGFGGVMEVKRYEDVPVMNVNPKDFYRDGEYINYSGNDKTALRGIDVSYVQGDIDWEAVRSDSVEFAIIRIGRRGYGESGSLKEDDFFRQNIDGARAAGIKVGVYFFSQAITTEEAAEEAEFVLGILNGESLDFPVAFEWERINFDAARTDTITGTAPTDFALAFCDKIKEGGYEPMVYFTRSMAYFEHDLSKLNGIKLWSGSPGETPDFYYDQYMWQYSITGNVSGIDIGTDLNLCFQEK